MSKNCSICDQNKTLNLFGQDKRKPDGRKEICKDCQKKYSKEEIKTSNLTGILKYCLGCDQEKDLNDFYKDAGRPDGHKCKCKSCQNSQKKEYLKIPENGTKLKEYNKQYCKTWYTENVRSGVNTNPEYYNQYRQGANTRFNKRRETD